MNEIINFIESVSEVELDYIAAADYGRDVDRHKKALKDLIFSQHGVMHKDQYWYPYEVVELRRWSCQQGHEREFAICHLIIALSIIAGTDISNCPTSMLEDLSHEYEKLPKEIYTLVIDAMTEASLKEF